MTYEIETAKEEFDKLSEEIETLKPTIRHTFNIKEKDAIRDKIKKNTKRIDEILDEYNIGKELNKMFNN